MLSKKDITKTAVLNVEIGAEKKLGQKIDKLKMRFAKAKEVKKKTARQQIDGKSKSLK
eukprot:TRINITY_DN8828_c0_g1_i1.p3 TRINITY_DN8828_c0_g1~~TRINITY_DN8828_c0_g1_i1.p3  ORF type:complete len:58 (+),score=14.99 TRINITY_DN8828_c0_g1_i1:515-688(+)